jgi:hypothetical protein
MKGIGRFQPIQSTEGQYLLLVDFPLLHEAAPLETLADPNPPSDRILRHG